MDPEGMGVHMGPSAAQLPLGKDRKEVPAAAPPLVPEMATQNQMLGVFVDISKVMGNALVTSSKTVLCTLLFTRTVPPDVAATDAGIVVEVPQIQQSGVCS